MTSPEKKICYKCETLKICNLEEDGWLCPDCKIVRDIEKDATKQMPKGDLSFLRCTCKCGNITKYPYEKEWDFQVIGMVQWQCKLCGNISTIIGFGSAMWHGGRRIPA